MKIRFGDEPGNSIACPAAIRPSRRSSHRSSATATHAFLLRKQDTATTTFIGTSGLRALWQGKLIKGTHDIHGGGCGKRIHFEM